MNQDLQKKLDQVRLEYSKGLPKRVEDIENSWNILSNQWSKEEEKEFHQKVHGLHGSAATFGYKEISEIANELENIIRNIPNDNLSNKIKEKITKLIQELKIKIKV